MKGQILKLVFSEIGKRFQISGSNNINSVVRYKPKRLEIKDSKEFSKNRNQNPMPKRLTVDIMERMINS